MVWSTDFKMCLLAPHPTHPVADIKTGYLFLKPANTWFWFKNYYLHDSYIFHNGHFNGDAPVINVPLFSNMNPFLVVHLSFPFPIYGLSLFLSLLSSPSLHPPFLSLSFGKAKLRIWRCLCHSSGIWQQALGVRWHLLCPLCWVFKATSLSAFSRENLTSNRPSIYLPCSLNHAWACKNW